MEYHDMYHHDFNESNEMNDSSTLNTLGKFKGISKHYHKLWRVRGEDKNKFKVQIGVHSSGDTGYTFIRNAETGEATSYVVGSLNEDLFFKVRVATGEIPTGPITLFYNSPEHYEKHQHIVVSDDMKYIWREKNRIRLLKNIK